jgi:hypothetical protein
MKLAEVNTRTKDAVDFLVAALEAGHSAANEAIIVDSRIPACDDKTVAFVKELLALSLKDHYVKGFILTGFDDDHCDLVGTSIVLRKYRPDWVMYPKYFKETEEARPVFNLLDEEEELRRKTANPMERRSVRLDLLAQRHLKGLSDNFDFELFSPHIEDMDCSNNCSIVLKLTGRGPRGFSYLITGDTENDRWDTINQLFRGRSEVPRYGSRPPWLEECDPSGFTGQHRPSYCRNQRGSGQPVWAPSSKCIAGLQSCCKVCVLNEHGGWSFVAYAARGN